MESGSPPRVRVRGGAGEARDWIGRGAHLAAHSLDLGQTRRRYRRPPLRWGGRRRCPRLAFGRRTRRMLVATPFAFALLRLPLLRLSPLLLLQLPLVDGRLRHEEPAARHVVRVTEHEHRDGGLAGTRPELVKLGLEQTIHVLYDDEGVLHVLDQLTSQPPSAALGQRDAACSWSNWRGRSPPLASRTRRRDRTPRGHAGRHATRALGK